MLNEIIAGISRKLYDTFGFTIYVENVAQGLIMPCFLIRPININHEQIMGMRYYMHNSFDICYFSSEKNLKHNLFAIGEQLQTEMEYIALGNNDLLHATGSRFEIIDDVLHFFVNYNLVMRKEQVNEDAMETLYLK